jgi:hypothetical protein
VGIKNTSSFEGLENETIEKTFVFKHFLPHGSVKMVLKKWTK